MREKHAVVAGEQSGMDLRLSLTYVKPAAKIWLRLSVSAAATTPGGNASRQWL
jgi:hypothetical protein